MASIDVVSWVVETAGVSNHGGVTVSVVGRVVMAVLEKVVDKVGNDVVRVGLV